jgi:hypothetical protein
MSLPWTAENARTYAIAHGRPVVTRVDSDMWVMYPADRTASVRGGYPADDPATAEAITAPIAWRVWGMAPLIIDRLLVCPPQTKKGRPAK